MKFIALLALTLLFTGCISRQKASRTASATVATAGAAALGYIASDGNVAATIGAGAAGLAAQSYAAHIQDKDHRAEVQTAFAAGEAKATRDLYDAIQNNQSQPTAQPETSESDATYLPIAAPRRLVNGVIVEPTVEYIRLNDQNPE